MRADSKLSRNSTSSKKSSKLEPKSPTKINKSEDNPKSPEQERNNSLFESSSENDDSSLFEKEKGYKKTN